MELKQLSRPEPPRDLYHALYDPPEHAGMDVRGFVVYDQGHKRVGTICEIYCDRETLRPRYVEIVPLDDKIDRSLMYPYDYVKWSGEDGPAFIPSPARALLEHEEYGIEHVLQAEGRDLITYSEAMDCEAEDYLSEQDIALDLGYRACA